MTDIANAVLLSHATQKVALDCASIGRSFDICAAVKLRGDVVYMYSVASRNNVSLADIALNVSSAWGYISQAAIQSNFNSNKSARYIIPSCTKWCASRGGHARRRPQLAKH